MESTFPGRLHRTDGEDLDTWMAVEMWRVHGPGRAAPELRVDAGDAADDEVPTEGVLE